MFVELQLSAGVFGRIVRERLRALDTCNGQGEEDEYVAVKDGVETRLAVDRIEIVDATEIGREATPGQVVWLDFPHNYTSFVVPFMQVRQPVTVHLVDVAKLEANGAAPTPPDLEFTLKLVLNVSARVADKIAGRAGAVSLHYELAHIDFGILTAAVSPEQRTRLENRVRRFQLPPTTVDLSSLSDITPDDSMSFAAFNAGITCDAEGQRVALRVETRRDTDLTAEWFSRDPDALVDEAAGRHWALMLDSRILSTSVQALVAEGLGGSSKVKLRGTPTVSYDPGSLAVLGGRPGLDVSVDGEAVDACPFFVDDMDVDFHADIRVTLSVPVVNTLRMHFTIEVGPSDVAEELGCAVTLGLLWPFIGLVMAGEDTITLPEYLGTGLLPPIGRSIAVFVMVTTAGLPDDVDPLPKLEQRRIDDEHYEVDSPIDVSPRGLGARLDLATVSGSPIGPVLCGPVVFQRNPPPGAVERVDVIPFGWRLAGRCGEGFSVVNQAEIFVAVSGAGTHLCSARVLGDEHHAFALHRDGNSVVVTCTFPPAYQAGPRYPCRVRLVTNRGLRTITIPAPVDVTEEEKHDLETERIGRIGECKGWLQHPIKDIKWIVDPPDVLTAPQLRFWQVVVKGLNAEERVTLQLPDGPQFVTAVASPHGVAHLSVLLDAAEGVDRLHARLDGQVGNEAPEVMVQQVLFVRRSSLSARGDLRELAFERRGAQHVLRFRGLQEERTWDVGPRSLPALLSTRAVGRPADDEIAVHTGKRVTPLAELADLHPRAQEIHRATTLRSSATALLGAPRIGGIRQAVFLGERDTGVLVDLAAPEQREAQTYHRQPWFVGVAMQGELLARHDPQQNLIELYEAVASRRV
jgi:hypothetical protein